MFVDSVIIVSMIAGCLAFFIFVAIFAAVFQRELGTKKRKELEEGATLEKQRLTPVQDEAEIEYTTETIQPDSKTPVTGYPHAQVNVYSVGNMFDLVVSTYILKRTILAPYVGGFFVMYQF